MPARGQHTVIVFKELQFRGDWTRTTGTNDVVYTANKSPQLIVLVEDRAGNNVTYYFTLKPKDEVWVFYGGDAQAHIPAICTGSKRGNQIQCRG